MPKPNTPIETAQVWHGKKSTVGAYVKEGIYKTLPKTRKKYLKVAMNYSGPIEAPIKKDQIIGKLVVSYKDDVINEYDLLAHENVKRLKEWSKDKSNLNSYQWDIVQHYLNIGKRPFGSASWTVVEPNCHFTK